MSSANRRLYHTKRRYLPPGSLPDIFWTVFVLSMTAFLLAIFFRSRAVMLSIVARSSFPYVFSVLA